MIAVSKSDWKLFQEKLPVWQENYMERLIKEYISLLSVNIPARFHRAGIFRGVVDLIEEV